ncbi:DNA polymerase [Paramuricea clavata]|uniref:DNA polymerase n=1 Tax=Paramuricea clavata TaxID=317549 RepID=A0A6S7IAA8_PARCT|nr:DNA polymerase [Paramuricea clavata]
MKLADVPKTFGLTELQKGYFPHFFNRAENQDYVGPMPEIRFYDPNCMNSNDREKFLAWYKDLVEREYQSISKQRSSDYIADYAAKEGIQLDPRKIMKNPGLRALAKLMLNSFWGKFVQRSNMGQIKIVSDPAEYFDLFSSDNINVTNVNFIYDELIGARRPAY